MCAMAKTKNDIELQSRIKSLSSQLTEKGKTKEEIIEMIAGVCGISLRTASEHYRAWKAQQTLKEMGFNEECAHEWSNAFGTAKGLARECLRCHKVEDVSL